MCNKEQNKFKDFPNIVLKTLVFNGILTPLGLFNVMVCLIGDISFLV